MAEVLGNWKRTHYAGNLTEAQIDQRVTLMGWVQKKRNLGGLVFVDIRDRTGIAQVVFDEAIDKTAFAKANDLTGESVIAVRGVVKKRQSVNADLATGQIEVFADQMKVLSVAMMPPIHIADDDNANETLRLKYRYLDLRKPKMQQFLMTRHKLVSTIRSFLNARGFIDVETPVLTKPTPEGARDYLVPSRVHPGKFYALPQSPQLFKQLLMVAGFDKYYQIVKCFRDEDLRADRQPEFTQLDLEMSFVEQGDVLALNEALVKHLFKELLAIELTEDFLVMNYGEAMEKYGSDKPDMRFAMYLNDLSDIVTSCAFSVFSDTVKNGGVVKAIAVKDGVNNFSKKGLKNLEKTAKKYGAKGLAWVALKDGGFDSPIAKFLEETELKAIAERTSAADGDLILIVADKKTVVNNALGGLRLEVAKKLDLIDPNDFKILWVTDFPLFEYDEDDGRYYAKHHPFTCPMDEDIDIIESKPDQARAKAYDLVINGYEVGGGSIRIHDADLQARMFKALGLGQAEIENKFGFLVNAFKYGTPPHGGIAFGIDRLAMIFSGTDNIKDVIAFPKTQNASCQLTDAPSPADAEQLKELAIDLMKVEQSNE